MRSFAVCCLFTALALAACTLPAPDPADVARAEQLFDQMKRKDFAAVEARLAPELRDAKALNTLKEIAGFIPPDQPQSKRNVGSFTSSSPGERAVRLTFEYRYPDRVLVVQTGFLTREGQPSQIFAFHLQRYTNAELEAFRFTLDGKGLGQYLFLAATVLSPLTILAAIILLIRERGLGRKWLWALFILFGLGQVSMDWSTGQILPTLGLGIQLLGAGFMKASATTSPWVLTVSAPVGAVAFLVRWFRQRRHSAKEKPPLTG